MNKVFSPIISKIFSVFSGSWFFLRGGSLQFSRLSTSSSKLTSSENRRYFSVNAINTEVKEEPVRVLGQQYQLVDPSPWPVLVCLSLLSLMSLVTA
jgi:hypothetical protein